MEVNTAKRHVDFDVIIEERVCVENEYIQITYTT